MERLFAFLTRYNANGQKNLIKNSARKNTQEKEGDH